MKAEIVKESNGLNKTQKWVTIVLGAIAICGILTSAGMAWGKSIAAVQQSDENSQKIECIQAELASINAKLDNISNNISDMKTDIRELRHGN